MAGGEFTVHARLEDCTGWNGLQARCRARGCRNASQLHVPGLIKRFGGYTTLDRLEPRLRCTVCGARGTGRLDVTTFKPPPGKAAYYSSPPSSIRPLGTSQREDRR